MFGVSQSQPSSSIVLPVSSRAADALRVLLTCFALASLSACAEVPEGRFTCMSAAECPSDWSCRVGEASATETRCYSTSVDAGRPDVGIDAGVDGATPDVFDAGVDGFVADTPDVFDAGADVPDDVFDGGPDDGFVPDTRPDSCVDGGRGPTPEPCVLGEALEVRFVRVSESVGLPTDGLDGMDALCDDGFKAVVMSSTRHAGDPVGTNPSDWVLEPSTCYQLGGTLAFRTNLNAVTYGVPATELTGDRGNFWTGISRDWTPADDNCNGWTTNAEPDEGGARGSLGFETHQCTGDPFIGEHGVVDCDGGWGVLCVEQRPPAP